MKSVLVFFSSALVETFISDGCQHLQISTDCSSRTVGRFLWSVFFLMKGSLSSSRNTTGTDSKMKIIGCVVADSLDHTFHLKRHWRLFYLSSLCLCIFLIFHTIPFCKPASVKLSIGPSATIPTQVCSYVALYAAGWDTLRVVVLIITFSFCNQLLIGAMLLHMHVQV